MKNKFIDVNETYVFRIKPCTDNIKQCVWKEEDGCCSLEQGCIYRKDKEQQ